MLDWLERVLAPHPAVPLESFAGLLGATICVDVAGCAERVPWSQECEARRYADVFRVWRAATLQ